MSTSQTEQRSAGQFAQERFRARKRAWLIRIWWAQPLLAAVEVAIFALVGFLFYRGHMTFFWGMGVGCATAIVMCFADAPPHHIERWRQGADGEKATAKQLRPLLRDGWVLVNDVQCDRSNVDHILIGPAGVFLIDSKNLSGICTVSDGTLTVRWREDPDDGYENHSLARRTRAEAADLSARLQAAGLRRHWVQPMVVLWSDFEQQSIVSERVAWVRGRDLADVLTRRPVRLSADEVTSVAGVLGSAYSAPAHLRVAAGPPVGVASE